MFLPAGPSGALRQLVSIVGDRALSDEDRRTLAFMDDFERRLVGRGSERRSIDQTLDLAAKRLALFTGNRRRSEMCRTTR